MAHVQVKGITIPDTTMVEGQVLTLNGAGFRSIFLIDIYLESLYLTHPSSDADSIIQNSRLAQLRMEFLHGSVGRDMLAKGWRKGFERNQTAAMMAQREERLKQFSNLFGNVQKGEVFVFDFLSNGDTRISYNAHVQGKVIKAELDEAEDFLVWEVEVAPDDDSVAALKIDAGNEKLLVAEQDEEDAWWKLWD